MALKKQMDRKTNRNRAKYPDAYHRIVEVSEDRQRDMARFRVVTYADEGARRYEEPRQVPEPPHHPMPHNDRHIYDQTFEYQIPSERPVDLVAWGYEQIKGETFFGGAEDC
jgi:hypothetical protein